MTAKFKDVEYIINGDIAEQVAGSKLTFSHVTVDPNGALWAWVTEPTWDGSSWMPSKAGSEGIWRVRKYVATVDAGWYGGNASSIWSVAQFFRICEAENNGGDFAKVRMNGKTAEDAEVDRLFAAIVNSDFMKDDTTARDLREWCRSFVCDGK